MRFEPVAAVALALAPCGAFAVDYLNPAQAAAQLFPQAGRFEPREIVLDAGQMRRLEADGVRARSARWQLRIARRGDQTLGVVVVDDVIGKFERITYAVGIDPSGAIRGIEVLSYRESHGGEIRLAAWRDQFVGKTAASAIELGDDIAGISGATLSCSHVTEGVRRIVRIVAMLRDEGRIR